MKMIFEKFMYKTPIFIQKKKKINSQCIKKKSKINKSTNNS